MQSKAKSLKEMDSLWKDSPRIRFVMLRSRLKGGIRDDAPGPIRPEES
jgi:hypothetical protein